MKIIFLDFDGVLNTQRYYSHLLENHLPTEDEFGTLFDEEAVSMLKSIVDATDAEIVVTSCWRFMGLIRLREMWKKRNLPGTVRSMLHSIDDILKEYFEDLNEHMGLTRGAEIEQWLQYHSRVTNYVILDDVKVFDKQSINFVRINPNVGISESDAQRAIEILNK